MMRYSSQSLFVFNFEIEGILKQVIKSRLASMAGWFILLSSFLTLLFIYRLGSARVDKGFEPGMRDLGTYLRAGSTFFKGTDPYSEPGMRAGPSLLPFFGAIDWIMPQLFLSYFFNFLSLAGVLFFVSNFSKLPLKQHPTILVAIVWLSSLRENLVNVQVTGLLCFLISLGYRWYFSNFGFTIRMVGLIFVSFAVDLKPHLFGVFLLAICVKEKRVRLIFESLLTIICSHIILSLISQQNLSLNWIRKLYSLIELKQKGELGESLNLWPFIEYLGVGKELTSIVSVALFLSLVLLLIFVSKSDRIPTQGIYEFALLVPAFGFFFHYYDLAPLLGLLIANLVYEKRYRTVVLLLPLLWIPGSFSRPENIFLVTALLLLMKAFESTFKIVSVTVLFSSFCLWIVYSQFIEIFARFDLKQAAQMTSIILIVSILIFRRMNLRRMKAIS
jgi:hypothetical protein